MILEKQPIPIEEIDKLKGQIVQKELEIRKLKTERKRLVRKPGLGLYRARFAR